MMDSHDMEYRLNQIDMRIRALGDNIGASIIYWPQKWTVTAHLLNIRGNGDTPEDAIKVFENALTDHENRERNLARTLGVEAAE